MAHTVSQPGLLEFLRCDRMRNIVPLKMLTAHGAAIRSYFLCVGSDAGALLIFPTTAFPYDQQTYGDRNWVVLLVATKASLVEALLANLPPQQKFVFKLSSEMVRDQIAQHYSLTKVRAFISYTTDPQVERTYHPAVVMSESIDKRLYHDYAEQGHTRATIADYFADGEARAYTFYQAQRPVAACFTYTNFEEIHEIGGVLTIPSARRHGYAKLVVESTLHALHERGRIPRYQVDATNIPSIRLAESLGLTPFVTVEHWLNAL